MECLGPIGPRGLPGPPGPPGNCGPCQNTTCQCPRNHNQVKDLMAIKCCPVINHPTLKPNDCCACGSEECRKRDIQPTPPPNCIFTNPTLVCPQGYTRYCSNFTTCICAKQNSMVVKSGIALLNQKFDISINDNQDSLRREETEQFVDLSMYLTMKEYNEILPYLEEINLKLEPVFNRTETQSDYDFQK